MDKSEVYDKIIAVAVSLLTFLMPLVDMFLVALVFILLAFVMEKEAEKKEAKINGLKYLKFGFWKGLKKILSTTFFRGLFVGSAYMFDYFIASKYIYPLLQEKIHPGIDYVVTMIVLIGVCWHYFAEADRNCKVVFGKGIVESFSILFDKLYSFASKVKNLKKED